jgi:hypothetical protein
LFSGEIAEALGLNLEDGVRRRFRTANSGFDTFGQEVELSVLGIATTPVVYFFADSMMDKNVLGRTGWLDRVRIGSVHHDNRVYLAPYDQDRFPHSPSPAIARCSGLVGNGTGAEARGSDI